MGWFSDWDFGDFALTGLTMGWHGAVKSGVQGAEEKAYQWSGKKKEDDDRVSAEIRAKDKILQDEKDRLAAEREADAARAAGNAIARKSRSDRAGSNRNGTILTSPIGVIGGSGGGGKTLLGQ